MTRRVDLQGAKWMKTRPQTYTGSSGEKEPSSFYLGNQLVDVLEILDQWKADYRYFKVKARGQKLYVLRHASATDTWDVAPFGPQR